MKYTLIFVGIILLSIFLRFGKLGSFPPGFTWDEAAIGYNAWGILTIHRDEWLNRMPFSFRSFGDYKSPLGIYMTALSQVFFGPTVYSVRFPVALAGVLLVVASYYLTREVLGRDVHAERISLVVMLLTAVSPTALHFSRMGFESMIAASLAAWGAVFFFRGVRTTPYFILSGICYSLSLYAYHSAKVVVPLTIVVFLFVYREALRPRMKAFALFFLTCVLVSLPLVYVSFYGKASDRFYGSTILLDANRKLKPVGELMPILISNFLSHLQPSYLFFGEEQTYRHSNMLDGILSPIEGMLILVALIVICRSKKNRPLTFIVILILISIIPAVLGFDVPHVNRALLGLPWYQVLAGLGFYFLWQYLEKKKYSQLQGTVLVIFIALVICGLAWHMRNNARVYATPKALSNMQYGYLEAVAYARSQESSVDRIYFSNAYRQAYIYILFSKHMNPIDYRGGGLANYVITDHPYADAVGKTNVLVIGTDQQIPDAATIEKEILFPDGSVAFQVVRQ